jgi:DNA-directed RNA polymerase subunit omega
MARITTEDCERVVPNRFELVLLAAERARNLACGAPPLVPPGREPLAVVALREVAAGKVEIDDLRDHLIARLTGRDDAILIPATTAKVSSQAAPQLERQQGALARQISAGGEQCD